MYSRFSTKEIVALSITGISTLLMVSVLFMASANTTTEDFITGLENAFPAPAPVTSTGTTSTGNTTTNTWNTTTNTSPTTTTNTSWTNGSTSGTAGTNTSGNNNTTSNTTNNSATTSNGTGRPATTNTSNTTNNSATTSNGTGRPATTNTSNTTNTVQSAPNWVIESIPTRPTTTPVIPVFTNNLPTSNSTTSGNNASVSGVSDSNTTTTGNSTALGGGLNSASQCKLPAIKILQVEELDTKTIVRWREIIGAAGYDVLKRSQSGEFVFIERVTQPIYTAHLARGAVKYEDFKIAAVCWDTKSASINTSEVTSVKTGPVQLILLLVLAMNIGAAIMLRNNFKKS